MDVDFKQAVEVLRSGDPLVFNTDTVAGIGVSIVHASGPQKLFKAKGRDEGKPIAWLVGSKDSLDEYGRDVPEYARVLVDAFWPGALTLVIPASTNVPDAFLCGKTTIGLRMPDSKTVLSLIDEIASPIATTSANVSGCPAPKTTQGLLPDFAKDLFVFAGYDAASPGLSTKPISSTVIDCTAPQPRILRAGTILPLQIESALVARGKGDACLQKTQ